MSTTQLQATTSTTTETLGRATYSPEDNKLRLYPTDRLDEEVYAEFKEAGFRWAPKQELFVAPAWSPARYDLLVKHCGEIEDEDTTLMDRATAKAERLGNLSERTEQAAESARLSAKAIANNIPFGQPILIGHHSEKRARRDAEKIQNGMNKAVQLWESSKYWADRAKSAVSHARYKEKPAVRERRIKTIAADMRKRQRQQDDSKRSLALWSVEEIAQEQARRIAAQERLNVATGADGSRWSTWDVLKADEDRNPRCPALTVEQVRAIAIPAYTRHIARVQRWIDHYQLRIAYEKAMIAESGGTVAQRTLPEVGGAVQCWATPARGWSHIIKVNKVSVSLRSKADHSGRVFTRTMALDKLHAVMSKAEVELARAAGLVFNENEEGFYLAVQPAIGITAEQEEDQERAAKEAEFAQLKQAAKAGVQVVSSPDLYATPAALADRMVRYACLQPGDTILEPSAGTGNLLAAAERVQPGLTTVAVELDRTIAHHLSTTQPANVTVQGADFLQLTEKELGKYSVILMNPPFSNGADMKHILHALKFLLPGGRLVAICANGPRQQTNLQPLATHWEALPAGTFKEVGTNVNTALLLITK